MQSLAFGPKDYFSRRRHAFYFTRFDPMILRIAVREAAGDAGLASISSAGRRSEIRGRSAWYCGARSVRAASTRSNFPFRSVARTTGSSATKQDPFHKGWGFDDPQPKRVTCSLLDKPAAPGGVRPDHDSDVKLASST
jgi:hypothetical protein